MLNKKDVIEMNKAFHTGKFANESSLDFALTHVNRSKNWLKTAAVLARAILIDHVFEDGNKRTVAGVIMTLMHMNGLSFSAQKIDALIITITKNNLTSIRDIEKEILHGRE